MKLLAIDSSGLVASAAILENEILRAEYTINHKKTHSQTLLPMIEEIMSMTETKPEEIDAIAVAGGPGSFTGLRIGSATAKGLGMAWNKPIINVPTLMGLAYNYQGNTQILCPILDARRNQVYTGIYTFVKDRLVTYMEQCAMSISELMDKLKQVTVDKNNTDSVIFLGDGVPVYRSFIEEQGSFSYKFAPAHLNGQRAGAVGSCAMQLASEGKMETAAWHRPEYLRLSQAERERRKKQSEKSSV